MSTGALDWSLLGEDARSVPNLAAPDVAPTGRPRRAAPTAATTSAADAPTMLLNSAACRCIFSIAASGCNPMEALGRVAAPFSSRSCRALKTLSIHASTGTGADKAAVALPPEANLG